MFLSQFINFHFLFFCFFIFRIHSPYVDEFDSYYRSLNPQNNHDNPWFAEFWEENYHCRLTVATAKSKESFNGTGECSSNLSITDYIQVYSNF